MASNECPRCGEIIRSAGGCPCADIGSAEFLRRVNAPTVKDYIERVIREAADAERKRVAALEEENKRLKADLLAERFTETKMPSKHPHLDELVRSRPTAREVMLWLLRGGIVRWYSLSCPTFYDERINESGRAEYRNSEGKWNDRMLDRHGLTVQSDTFVPARLLSGPTSICVRPFGMIDSVEEPHVQGTGDAAGDGRAYLKEPQ